MAATFGEELRVGDRYGYAAAETGAGESLGELGGIVGFGVAGWFFGHCECGLGGLLGG